MSEEFNEARKKDLGMGSYSNWLFEIMLVERELDYVIDNVMRWARPKHVDTPLIVGPAESMVLMEPLGVVVVLGSWNYPLVTTLKPLISVIAAGNTCVVKPSEMSLYSSQCLQKLIDSALDQDCFKCVQGGVETAIRATSSLVDQIIYTGSTEKGRLVAQAAAKNLVPCILELGGKSPMIVDKGADCVYSGVKAALGAFCNFGQTCIRPDYCLVEYTMVHKFVDELSKQLKDYD